MTVKKKKLCFDGVSARTTVQSLNCRKEIGRWKNVISFSQAKDAILLKTLCIKVYFRIIFLKFYNIEDTKVIDIFLTLYIILYLILL